MPRRPEPRPGRRPGSRPEHHSERRSEARPARAVALPLDPSAGGEGPLPARLAAQLRDLVVDGTLRPRDPLPSTRALAERLGIARGSVVAAYEQLSAEGYLAAERGSGTIVHPALAMLPRPVRPTTAPPQPAPVAPLSPSSATASSAPVAPARTVPAPIDLRPGSARGLDVAASPAWRRAWREAAARPSEGRTDPLGAPRVREVMAERLRRVRAVRADPAAVVMTTGARDGLLLVLQALDQRLGRRLAVAFESPGYPGLRRVPQIRGDRVLDAPVDEHGIDPARLPAGLDVLVVTPSHQYPLGGSLPVERRLAILDAARAGGVLVVEDEHTAEWRWEGAPLPALAGLDDPADPRVALLTSLSSLVDPAVAAGSLLAPPWLLEHLAAVRAATGSPLGAVAQHALAEFVGSGALDRALQGARRDHRGRLQTLRTALAPTALAVQDVPGGLSAVVVSPVAEAELVERARAHGVLVDGLGRYWAGPPPRPGIAVGTGIDAAALAEGARRLARAAPRP